MLPHRIRRQNALILAIVSVTIAAVVGAVVYLIWVLANSVDLSEPGQASLRNLAQPSGCM